MPSSAGSRIATALLRLGPLIEEHERFPARTNVQFVRVDGLQEVTAAVWERGAGETSASGSSAVAVAAAAIVNGWCESPGPRPHAGRRARGRPRRREPRDADRPGGGDLRGRPSSLRRLRDDSDTGARRRSRTRAGRRSGSSSGRSRRCARRRSARTRARTSRPGTPSAARPGARPRAAARSPRYSTGSAPVTSMIGIEAERTTFGAITAPGPDVDALDDDRPRADERAVLDDHRPRLSRLEHAADADAAREMDVGADLSARADGRPRVDHRARPDPRADVHVAGHQHDALGEKGAVARHAGRHHAHARARVP